MYLVGGVVVAYSFGRCASFNARIEYVVGITVAAPFPIVRFILKWGFSWIKVIEFAGFLGFAVA